MPLTEFQLALLSTLTAAPNDDRYLAGGAALHFSPTSARCSDGLDFFHDSEARVAAAFAADRARLEHAGYHVDVELTLPGFVRTVVRRGDDSTRVDWARDSAWRFMPLRRHPTGILLLDPTDLAINKVLALAGRDESRDFVDVLIVHRHVLPLSALVWAAVGKDPGLAPLSLLELLKRHGRYRPEDFERLHLAQPFDLREARQTWLAALEAAATFASERPPGEIGCLYYSTPEARFVVPRADMRLADQGVQGHFGAPGGVLPQLTNASIEAPE